MERPESFASTRPPWANRRIVYQKPPLCVKCTSWLHREQITTHISFYYFMQRAYCFDIIRLSIIADLKLHFPVKRHLRTETRHNCCKPRKSPKITKTLWFLGSVPAISFAPTARCGSLSDYNHHSGQILDDIAVDRGTIAGKTPHAKRSSAEIEACAIFKFKREPASPFSGIKGIIGA